MVKGNGKGDAYDSDPDLHKKYSSRYVEVQRFKDFARNFEKEIERLESHKADNSGLEMAKTTADEAKMIAISARDKAMEPHACTQDSLLQSLKEKLGAGNKLKWGGVITLAIAIATFGTFLGMTTSSVAETRADVVQLDVKVDKNTKNITELTTAIENSQKANKAASTANLVELKAISAAIKELPKNNK